MQSQLGEWEPGFYHSLECGERRDTHYLTPLLDLLPLFLACVPLSPPPTSLHESKDLKNQGGVQTEGGGAGRWRWGVTGVHRARAGPESPSTRQMDTPIFSQTTPGHGENSGKGLLRGPLRLASLSVCISPVQGAQRKWTLRGGDRETEAPKDKRQRLGEAPGSGDPVSPGPCTPWNQGPLNPENTSSWALRARHRGSQRQASGKPGPASPAPALGARERRRGKWRLHFEKCVCGYGKGTPRSPQHPLEAGRAQHIVPSSVG